LAHSVGSSGNFGVDTCSFLWRNWFSLEEKGLLEDADGKAEPRLPTLPREYRMNLIFVGKTRYSTKLINSPELHPGLIRQRRPQQDTRGQREKHPRPA